MNWKKLYITVILSVITIFSLSFAGCESTFAGFLNKGDEIVFVEPNEPVSVPYPAVLLHRGRYFELIKFEAESEE